MKEFYIANSIEHDVYKPARADSFFVCNHCHDCTYTDYLCRSTGFIELPFKSTGTLHLDDVWLLFNNLMDIHTESCASEISFSTMM